MSWILEMFQTAVQPLMDIHTVEGYYLEAPASEGFLGALAYVPEGLKLKCVAPVCIRDEQLVAHVMLAAVLHLSFIYLTFYRVFVRYV
jgi:hypothetical protein